MDRIDKAARDLKLQIQTNSDTPTDDLTDGTLANSRTATLTSSSQNLAPEVPTEFSFGADQPNNDELWQTDFAPSAMEDEEVTMTRGSGRRARAGGC